MICRFVTDFKVLFVICSVISLVPLDVIEQYLVLWVKLEAYFINHCLYGVYRKKSARIESLVQQVLLLLSSLIGLHNLVTFFNEILKFAMMVFRYGYVLWFSSFHFLFLLNTVAYVELAESTCFH